MPQSSLFHRTYGAGSCDYVAVSKFHRTNVLFQGFIAPAVLFQSFCSAESASKAEPNALTNYQLPITNYQSPSGTQNKRLN